jgi:hypothetical protein
MLLLGFSVDLNSVRYYFANAKFKLHDGMEDSGCAWIAPLQWQVGIAFWLINSPPHAPLCISRMSGDSGWQNLLPEFSKLVVRIPNSVWRLFLRWLVLISEVCLSNWSGWKLSRSRVCGSYLVAFYLSLSTNLQMLGITNVWRILVCGECIKLWKKI